MTVAYVNEISTAVPHVDVHHDFIEYARRSLEATRYRPLFKRMVERSQIDHRWSFLEPTLDAPDGALDREGLYRVGAFPTTAARMRVYERRAPELAAAAVAGLDLGPTAQEITHLVVASCTGFSAPGVDLMLVERMGLDPSVERTMVGFMGCYAAMNALKLARHIVRSEPDSRVLVVCVELCTLHFQESAELEQVLSFLIFGDGCAAALVSAEPRGLALDRFKTLLSPAGADLITWNIRDQGFDMVLSGQAPKSVAAAVRGGREAILGNLAVGDIDLWAVHPGGRSILDAVETALELGPETLALSRKVLRDNGNMSSATILFVLKALMETAAPDMRGCGMAFGPGLTAETLLFSTPP
jgi:predicted naringenin-chalcone synthase